MLNEGFLPLQLILAFIPMVWLITRFHQPKKIEGKFAASRKDAGIATAFVVTCCKLDYGFCSFASLLALGVDPVKNAERFWLHNTAYHF